MTVTRAELRAMAAAQDSAESKPAESGAVMDGTFAEFLGALHGVERISRSTALNIPAVAGGIEFITTQAAAVPFKLYRKTGKGLEEVKASARAEVLNLNAGDLLSSTEMLEALYRDYLLSGNGYLYINRWRNQVESLHYVDCEQVAVTVDPDPIFKTGHLHVYGKTYRPWEFVRLCRHSKDGMHGSGILQENSKMLALAWATLVLQNSMMRGGGNARGYVTSERNLTKPQIEELKSGFAQLYTAEGNGVVVLNRGLDFKQSSNTAVEMQLQEIVQQNRQEILLMLGVPYEVLKGSGTEDQFNAAIQRAVVPVITAMETALNRDLLMEQEKGKLIWKADTTELTKGAIKQRYEAYKLAADGGWLGKNEIRARENLPTVDGLDVIGMNLADVLFDMKTGKYYTPNTGSVVGADGKEEAPGDNSPALADGQEKSAEKAPPDTLPDAGKDGTIEDRSRDYKRDDKGRFAYDGGEKKRKTKYAPSRRKNASKINLKPDKYAMLAGAFKTRYPQAKPADGVLTISDGKYMYYATAADNGGIRVMSRQKIK